MTKYLLTTLIFLLGCDTSMNASKSDITIKFFLTNEQGIETTQFQFGEDIFFSYSIENTSSKIQHYVNHHSGPFVRFEVSHLDNAIGTSYDGLVFLPVLVADSLKAGEALIFEYNWQSLHSPNSLSVAEYTANAQPILKFNDVANPMPEEIKFRVNPPAPDFVKISDLPPDSLQLHTFDLNSVAVSGNDVLLKLSYSGGCEEHEFELFMSPGAFLESNPVQANLFLRHNDKDDACDAYITTEVSFDLTPLAELHQQFYGRKDEIILNVFDYFQDQPGRHLTGRYSP